MNPARLTTNVHPLVPDTLPATIVNLVYSVSELSVLLAFNILSTFDTSSLIENIKGVSLYISE